MRMDVQTGAEAVDKGLAGARPLCQYGLLHLTPEQSVGNEAGTGSLGLREQPGGGVPVAAWITRHGRVCTGAADVGCLREGALPHGRDHRARGAARLAPIPLAVCRERGRHGLGRHLLYTDNAYMQLYAND